MALTKIDLVDMIYGGLDLPKKRCVNAVDSVFDIIKDELARGNDVMIPGFGKWSIKSKKQRMVRHPQTGQDTIISARKVVTFKCSEKLKGELQQKRITFKYHAPYAETVFVAGSFNGWNSEANPMKRDMEGTWSAVVDLYPGTYEYRFIVDGRWKDDPTCEIRHLNLYGGYNCVLIIE